MKYRSARSIGLSRRQSAWEAMAPVRVRVALHVLRGRPTMYRWVGYTPLVILADHSLVADSSFGPAPIGSGSTAGIEIPLVPNVKVERNRISGWESPS